MASDRQGKDETCYRLLAKVKFKNNKEKCQPSRISSSNKSINSYVERF